MNNWNVIQTEENIKYLLTEYHCFLDSCIVNAHYETESSADMYCDSQDGKILHITFYSQSVNKTLELCFGGVRQFFLAGWQNYYSCEIDGCYLKIHTDLQLPTKDIPLIVWADCSWFSPFEPVEILKEPMISFVISSTLKWRFVKD